MIRQTETAVGNVPHKRKFNTNTHTPHLVDTNAPNFPEHLFNASHVRSSGIVSIKHDGVFIIKVIIPLCYTKQTVELSAPFS